MTFEEYDTILMAREYFNNLWPPERKYFLFYMGLKISKLDFEGIF